MKKSTFIIVGIIIVALLVAGCTANKQDTKKTGEQLSPVCNKPYILVGTSCCLDSDGNSICDKDEAQPPIEKKVCPASCDDGLSYTKDFCSVETNYECKYETIKNICGNQICETENKENTFTCATDCHRKSCIENAQCDDSNPCTKDTCTEGSCYNVERIDVPCYYHPFNGKAGAGVTVTALKVQNYTNGSVYSFGEVTNGDVETLKSIKLNFLIYKWEENDAGILQKTLALNKTGKIFFDMLAPGQKSPFYINLGNIENYASYKYAVSFVKTNEKPYADFAVDVKKCGTAEGYETIIKNTGNENAYDVVIYYLFRDYPSNEVLRVDWEPLKSGTISADSMVTVKTMNCGGPNYLTHYIYTSTKVSS